MKTITKIKKMIMKEKTENINKLNKTIGNSRYYLAVDDFYIKLLEYDNTNDIIYSIEGSNVRIDGFIDKVYNVIKEDEIIELEGKLILLYKEIEQLSNSYKRNIDEFFKVKILKENKMNEKGIHKLIIIKSIVKLAELYIEDPDFLYL